MKSCIVTLFPSLVYGVGIAQKTADEVVGKVIEAQSALAKLKVYTIHQTTGQYWIQRPESPLQRIHHTW